MEQFWGLALTGGMIGGFTAFLVVAARAIGIYLAPENMFLGIGCILIVFFAALWAVGAATNWGARAPFR